MRVQTRSPETPPGRRCTDRRTAAATAAHAAAHVLWIASGVAETLAFAIFAAWVTAGLRATGPRFTSDWLMVTGSWWFTIALASETVVAVSAAVDSVPALAVSPPGFYAMSLYGGVFGWVLGVAMRAVPMFIAGRRGGAWASPP